MFIFVALDAVIVIHFDLFHFENDQLFQHLEGIAVDKLLNVDSPKQSDELCRQLMLDLRENQQHLFEVFSEQSEKAQALFVFEIKFRSRYSLRWIIANEFDPSIDVVDLNAWCFNCFQNLTKTA